ncbi:uncharacterized protein LOC115561956 [Drosophila navojoa]|uniref:uncharacterized protein LOC115561956 n=1 Tax=Drosophila navojoa TaxID=7232 RepID=UPI0011BDFDF4|nr:uncharacterized protein LOC115561956 [Drosophila navojoa]
MTTLLSLSILLAVALSSEGAKYHYHRYMLSDYRPQHRHGLQRDYKPVTRYPHFATETTAAPGELTVNVKPNGSRPKTNNTVNVDKLMMRVIDGRKKYCMGIPKSSRVLVMTTSCALNLVSGPTTIRTSEGKTIAVNITAVTNYFMYSLTEIHVDQPLINDTEIPATCTNRLQPENIAQVSVYGRQGVINELVKVKPHKYCRALVNETFDYRDTTLVCVENSKEFRSTGCSGNYGSPLVFNNQICGMNIMGRRCLPGGAFDLYALVLDETAYERRMLARIIESQVEDKIL